MSQLVRPEFPTVIDSSLIATFRSCPRKAFLEYFQHWKGKEVSVHLHAGGAYAHGLEAGRKAFFEEGKSAEESVALAVGACITAYGAFQCPEDSAKSATRMAGAVEYYFSRYPLGVDKAIPLQIGERRAIEFGGVEILDETHPETGEPLQYSWRMDQAVEFDGMKLGEDDKTTSALGASWPRQWDLRSQFTSYIWGAKRSLGLELNGFLVRGVSTLKTKYDTLQAITYRPDWQLARWEEQLYRDIRRMKQMWAEGYFDYNLDHACSEYGGCMFREVCLSKDPDLVLPQLYARRKWDPIRRIEIPLEVPGQEAA